MTECVIETGWFTGQAICRKCGDECECYICTDLSDETEA